MKRLTVLALLVLLLAGCVGYNEELWLNKDGSGRVRMVIGVLTTYKNTQEINRYTDLPGINLISRSVYRKKNYTYYNVYLSFNSLEAFNSLNDQVSNTDFFGKLSLVKNKDGTVTMNRRIALGSPSAEEDEIEQLIQSHPHENLNWRYTIHLPYKIVDSNAETSNVDLDKRIITWVYQTKYLWNKSQTMTVTMKPAFPWLAVVLIGIGFLLVLISLIWWRRHIRKMHAKHLSDIASTEPRE